MTAASDHPPPLAKDTIGRHQRVVANFVEITSFPVSDVFQYDITITPREGDFKKLPRPDFMRGIFDDAMRRHRADKLGGTPMVYDARRIAFAPKRVCAQDETLARHGIGGRAEDFKVAIREAAIVSMDTLRDFISCSGQFQIQDVHPALMALDLVVGSVAHDEMTGFRRSFFTRADSMSTSRGLELWRGFSLSVRPGEGKLYLNVNTAVTAMYRPGPLVQAIQDLLGMRNPNDLRRGLGSQGVREIAAYLRGLSIMLRHRGIQGSRKVAVKGLTSNPLDKESFDWDDPNNPGKVENISIYDYYQRRYNIKLQYPFLPGLVGRKNAIYPIELCEVMDKQRYKGRLDDQQTADMVRFACQRPSENHKRIVDVLGQLNFEASPAVKAFGLELKSNLTEVDSRVLPPPAINYGQQSREAAFTPTGGAWNMRDKCVMHAGAVLESWTVLVLANQRSVPLNQVQNFVTTLVRMCNSTGYCIGMGRPPITYGNPSADIGREMSKACKSKPQLLLVILPSTNLQTYQNIKNYAYTTMGIHTQCMQSKHVHKANPQYCANLCLKINVKMGGSNQSLPVGAMQKMLHSMPTLFLGCDVSHPSPGETDRPSMASVVGSVDFLGLRYAATLIQLPSRQELVDKLQEAIIRHLKLFYKYTKAKPKRIIFYRDGVSETQFAQVRSREIIEISRACTQIETGYQPDVTFIAMLKRHNTRFFPMGRDGDRTGNCVPGTVVDTAVTLPAIADFYLFAHAAIQGTSRPTHYCVLHDDSKFTRDEIQQLTYNLCYTYAICTRSVSMVPPVYYAHRVADRARCHFADMGVAFRDATVESAGFYGGTGTSAIDTTGKAATDPNMQAKIIRTHERLDESMYFM
ncbi:Piwi-domain-containing protein [Linderina pennispora]|uniref:Piwi-domain-containing protein n=1 Tax=Linderina pennispora TaxID=61395 RepID=A0A1Y1WLA4_9FUNG|nr:Piwi-domain-containing protein [Linderina pennispora]ORX74282.1 Piwi-domain-containing protein [Linderina pennispora]